mmetsp:Transcript_1929/g.3223  ORF Transcript_1929/g.3223 Transcript_1929/m.3223 type:complete len:81 (-) Transcript_1929:758-1000(-)
MISLFNGECQCDKLDLWMRSLGLSKFHGIYTSLWHWMERFTSLLQLVASDIEALAVIGFLIHVPFVQTKTTDDKARKAAA